RRAGLRPLGAVLGPAALAVFRALRVERTSDNVVADARQILDTTAANQHNTVLLQVMADAWDVCGDFRPRITTAGPGEANARNLTKSGIRLLGRHRSHDQTDTALLRIAFHCRRL